METLSYLNLHLLLKDVTMYTREGVIKLKRALVLYCICNGCICDYPILHNNKDVIIDYFDNDNFNNKIYRIKTFNINTFKDIISSGQLNLCNKFGDKI